MQIRKAEFRCSSERISQVPKDDLRDIAFIGRSNVGKSSLVNMLTGRNGIAKVSGTPGKTRLINHFRIDNAWYLVDLPGYGYARTSKSLRSEFAKIITDYVLRCEKMHFLFVLVDIRLEPQKIDMRFIEMLGQNGIPFGIIFTKADKLSRAQAARSVDRYRSALAEQWEELPPLFVSSSSDGTGRQEILDFIGRCLQAPVTDHPVGATSAAGELPAGICTEAADVRDTAACDISAPAVADAPQNGIPTHPDACSAAGTQPHQAPATAPGDSSPRRQTGPAEKCLTNC